MVQSVNYYFINIARLVIKTTITQNYKNAFCVAKYIFKPYKCMVKFTPVDNFTKIKQANLMAIIFYPKTLFSKCLWNLNLFAPPETRMLGSNFELSCDRTSHPWRSITDGDVKRRKSQTVTFPLEDETDNWSVTQYVQKVR